MSDMNRRDLIKAALAAPLTALPNPYPLPAITSTELQPIYGIKHSDFGSDENIGWWVYTEDGNGVTRHRLKDRS